MEILYANVDRASREDFHKLIDTWKEEERSTIRQENLPENQAKPKRDAIDALADDLKSGIDAVLDFQREVCRGR